MKNFTKIFMAVVALFAFACTTDTTFDQTVELGAGQTTITLSLDEESRTHITGKEGDEYPLYWSEGDKIAVNGKTSNALGEASHGQTTATFTVEGEQPRPWNIVYPAPAEGVTAETKGCYPVTFMASQPYTANTFAEGSTPMYAYISENANMNLQHLAGVLRFDVKGNGEVLKALVVEVENGKISGNFDVNCATGEVTPHADATNTVTVTFPENGLTLSTDATPIYVAVPKGGYGEVTLTLYANDGKIMKGLFDSSAKAISAGKVREFPEFEFSSNNEPEAGVFLIYDETSLREFARRVNAAEENFDTTYPTAKVVANVKLTEPWASINGYTGTFDGCNHEIAGLDAPLFSTTSATLQNVNLDVNIVNTTLATMGGLVCTYTGTTISNCSVSGSIEVNDVAFVDIAGVVGNSKTATTLSGLQNSASITVNGNITTKNCNIAGCLGRIDNNSSTAVENCLNTGTITLSEETKITVDNDTYKILYIGGIAGYNRCKSMVDCENRGHIKIDGDFEGARLSLGGVVGDFRSGTIKGIRNSGNITFGATANINNSGYHLTGGLVGMFDSSNAFTSSDTNDSHNSGEIKIMKGAVIEAKDSLNDGVKIGGCIAHGNTSPTAKVSNSGNIEISGTINSALHCGGLEGWGHTLLENCGNSGNITIGADAQLNGAYANIGGFCGYVDKNVLRSTHSSGNILFNGVCTSPAIYIGGIAGLTKGDSDTNIKQHTNDGSITISSTATLNSGTNGQINIGGIVGFAQSHVLDGTNKGPITISGECTAATIRIGGITGYGNGGKRARCVNSETADITINSSLNCTGAYIGGTIGSTSNSIETMTNNGDVVIASTATLPDGFHIGGISGNTTYSTSGTSVNTGDILVNIVGVEGNTNRVSGGIANIDTACANGRAISNINVCCDIVAVGHSHVGMVTASTHTDKVVVSSCNVGGSIKKSDAEATPLSLDNYTTFIYAGGVELDSDVEKSVVNTNKCGWLSENINSSVQYKAIAGKTISSVAELIEWAANEAATSTDNVKLSANIDLSADGIDWSPFGEGAEGWKPIEGFAGSFDGGNYEIKGLTAPLFGTTQATAIKNVELTKVNITAGGKVVGSLACVINNTSAVVSNCSVQGTLTIENATMQSKVGTSIGNGVNYDSTHYGGLIGISTSTQKFSDLTSEVDITLQGANFYRPFTAIGISYVTGPLYKVNTLGTINYNVTNATDGVYCGGVAVSAMSSMTDCNNGSKEDTTHAKGSITLNGIEADSGCFAGLTCTLYGDMTNCHNYGNLTLGGTSGNIFFGGCIARATPSSDSSTITVKDCSNNGKMTISGTSGNNRYGGFLAESWGGSFSFDNCHNYGAIEHTSTSNVLSTIVGGVFGYNGHTNPMSFNNCSNNGEITLNGTAGHNRVGGFVGYNNGANALTLANCMNNGNVTVGGSSNNVYVGGVIGLNKKAMLSMSQIVNKGNVTCSTTTSSSTVFIGGIVASNEAGLINDARCHCTVTAWGYANVGMVTGSAYAETTKATNCHIGGTIDQGAYGEYTDDDNIEVTGWHSKPLPIRADVYYKAIYSNRDIDAAIAVDNGCGYISAIDAAPVYAEVE